MKIEVLFFGILADRIGAPSIQMEGIKNKDELLEKLNKLYPSLNKIKFALSCNKEITNSNIDFSDGDEVALLPPFAGG